MKRLLTTLLLILLFNTGFSSEFYCERRFQPLLEKIQAIPEGRVVTEQALEDGDITIQKNRDISTQFEGYWEAQRRTIHLTLNSRPSEADLLVTLLFELHNATRERDFVHLDQKACMGLINRAQYIRNFEYIEYQNVVSTAKILDIGRQKGVFPQGAVWRYNDSFEEHLRVQQRAGHSAFIGEIYDSMCG